jgi:hypothetical protein
LKVAAKANGKIMNFAPMAKDVGDDEKTVRKYFEVLEDTLILSFVDVLHRSVRDMMNGSFWLDIEPHYSGSRIDKILASRAMGASWCLVRWACELRSFCQLMFKVHASSLR